MKLATLHGAGRDGRLVVVDRAIRRALAVPHIARTLQEALDHWAEVAEALEDVYRRLCDGTEPDAREFDPTLAAAPLPRAFQWVDGSAYVNHVELVRKARGAELPESYWTEPLVYQGGSDDLQGPSAPIEALDETYGIDLEGEVAVITDDVPLACPVENAGGHIKLLMLVNDVSLRNLIPTELAKGFGFYQSKPATSFSPLAVTPDELGIAWQGGKVHRPLTVHVNGALFGEPECGIDMTFGFPALIAHAARTRRLGAGTIVGSGTISNYERARGSACIAEKRMLETLATGAPVTPFLRFGDRIRIEMFDADGASIFGAIEQRVTRASTVG